MALSFVLQKFFFCFTRSYLLIFLLSVCALLVLCSGNCLLCQYIQGHSPLSFLSCQQHLDLCSSLCSTWTWVLFWLIDLDLYAFYMHTSVWTRAICWRYFIFFPFYISVPFFHWKPGLHRCVCLWLGLWFSSVYQCASFMPITCSFY